MDQTWYQQLQVLEDEQKPLDIQGRLAAMSGPLLYWYEQNARVLPWREDPRPYQVWVSEIMLQQTRVEAVKPYFARFMNELPTIEALSDVSEDRLMKLWEGLGYYRRARNLKKAARMIVDHYGGRMPSGYNELLGLPGIGSYTAGAIASIAFGRPVPAVDGNVLRVISRVLASHRDILKQTTRKWMETELAEIIPPDQAGQFNQGLIEIGAVVCIPNGRPRCQECPLNSLCLTKRNGLFNEIPVKAKSPRRRIEKRTVAIMEYQDQVGLKKRPDSGLLAGLYELPNVEGHLKPEELAKAFCLQMDDIDIIERLPDARHIFSHVEWHMAGYRILLARPLPAACLTVPKTQVNTSYALPKAFGRYTMLIK